MMRLRLSVKHEKQHTETLQLNRELRTQQVSNTSMSASLLSTVIKEQYRFISSSDRFPVPVRKKTVFRQNPLLVRAEF